MWKHPLRTLRKGRNRVLWSLCRTTDDTGVDTGENPTGRYGNDDDGGVTEDDGGG